jgi:phosphotransferase system  glucose/maltose/N-acetylglucosamine-specific IIC component
MKRYLKLFAYVYTLSNIISFVIALGVIRRYDVYLPIREIFIGTIFISLLIAAAIIIFKKTWGNGVMNVILGYIILLPVPFTINRMYDGYILRRPTFIYLFGLIYAVLYTLVLIYAHHRNKKDEKNLNDLIKDKEDSTKQAD